jgi:hypothetical protein
MVKIGPCRSLRIFVCKSGFLPFLVLFLPFFGLDTESVNNISDSIALHFNNALILYFHIKKVFWVGNYANKKCLHGEIGQFSSF